MRYHKNALCLVAGALDVSWSTVVFSGNTTLSANSAQWYGGENNGNAWSMVKARS